jgi:hypothetical protein
LKPFPLKGERKEKPGTMIHLCLLLFTLAVHAASIGDIAAQTLDFCGEPDKSDYTLIQGTTSPQRCSCGGDLI